MKTESLHTILKGNMVGRSRRPILWFALSILAGVIPLLGPAGCSDLTPKIYKMPPDDLEKIRSGFGSVGVTISSYPPKWEISKPAKGVTGGAARGFVVGASLPVVIGFVTPVPGTTPLGVLIAPFTAVAGSVYGATKGMQAEDIEKAEASGKLSAARLKKMKLRKAFVNKVAKMGKERTGLDFVTLPEKGPGDPNEVIRYDSIEINGVDTVLELRVEKVGLCGFFTFDPPSTTYLEVGARLIRTSDNEVMINETFFCGSEVERTYFEWFENEGQLFVDEFVTCFPEIAEKIVDDLFLVYPIPTR